MLRELLWLLAILLIALLLDQGLFSLVNRMHRLNDAFVALKLSAYEKLLLYVLLVVGCYAARLGAYGVDKIVTKVAV